MKIFVKKKKSGHPQKSKVHAPPTQENFHLLQNIYAQLFENDDDELARKREERIAVISLIKW